MFGSIWLHFWQHQISWCEAYLIYHRRPLPRSCVRAPFYDMVSVLVGLTVNLATGGLCSDSGLRPLV